MEQTGKDSDINMDQSIGSVSSQNMSSGTGRKRGHQHHIRNSGNRTSNIKADEIIAALRRGDQLPIAQTIHQYVEQQQRTQECSDGDMISTDDHLTDSKLHLSNADHCVATTDQNGNRHSSKCDRNNTNNRNVTLIDDFNKNNRLDISSTTACSIVLSDSTNEQLNKINVISRGNGDLTDTAAINTETIGALNSDIDMDLIASKDDLNDSISSGSSSSSKKKSKRAKKPQRLSASSTTNSEPGAKKEKRSKKTKSLPPTEERPPLEGADANQWIEPDSSTADVENDPEAAEWSKLRCTSERAEVVAEREYRRQNRRCADYPGLAFGRSIFSSDTMMKLNIIRNELHNIMKTQLKRVRVMPS